MMPFRSGLSLICISLILLAACAPTNLRDQREAQAQRATTATPIKIGFVWPFSAEYDLLPEGVEMAVQEINAETVVCDTDSASPEATPEAAPNTNNRNCRIQPGGLLGGRKIELVMRDDFDSVREARLIAQELAEDVTMTAVIGHAFSSISIAAAPLYEFNGLIMLSPSATSPDLTRSEFHYIFRNIASDRDVGRQLATYAQEQGYERMVILYESGSYGLQLSNVFENEAAEAGILILDRRPYEVARNFAVIIDQWAELDFDAIFIAGSNPTAAEFVRDARAQGITQPIIGSDAMDTSALWDVAGAAATGTVIASFYHPDNPDSELQDFVIRFVQQYNTPPDTWAAQGYDAVWLLADAINRAGSTVPSAVAAALHDTRDWQGVTGVHTMSNNGDVIGKPLVLKIQQPTGLQFLKLATSNDEE
jgi:branched-chain amino acid transport system substrate-binding protein